MSALAGLASRLDGATALDAVARPLERTLDRLLGEGPVAQALRGRWLGHRVHPLLTDIPVGCWTSAWILDLVGGPSAEAAAQTLVGIGVVAVAPTAVTGWADWATLPAPKQRAGIVHAASNAVAAGLYAGSWAARRAGDHRRGVVLGHLGAAAATVGGYLGGHLAFGGGGPTATSLPESSVADASPDLR